jgi:hypothetical protein
MDPAATGAVVIAGLVALAILLFLLSGWSGRWALWLAGYFVVLLALALTAALHPASAGRGPGEPPAPPPTLSMEAS